MSAAIDRRLLVLESCRGSREPVTIIRIVTMPGHSDAEPYHATVRGVMIHRMADETADAFMVRVETEAKLAAKPGNVAAALVLPQVRPAISVEA